MPSIEERIERMWNDPVGRREQWAGFFGKLSYEVGGVAAIFLVTFGPIYAFVIWRAGTSFPGVLAPSAFIVPLFLWVANKAFCNIIGR